MARGFDSHIGYWTGHQDYFDHTAMETGMWGLDMRNGSDIAYDLHGQYTTDIIGRESVRIIERHNVSKPLFLYMAHAAVHSGGFDCSNSLDYVLEGVQYALFIYSRQTFSTV